MLKFQLGSLTLAKVDDCIFIMTGIFDFAVNQMAQLKVNYSASSDYKRELNSASNNFYGNIVKHELHF